MPIRFFCSSCSNRLWAADHHAGLRGACPDCGRTLTIPGPADAPPPRADAEALDRTAHEVRVAAPDSEASEEPDDPLTEDDRHFARLAVEQGLVDGNQVSAARLRLRFDAHDGRPRRPLAEVLVKQGYMDLTQAARVRRLQSGEPEVSVPDGDPLLPDRFQDPEELDRGGMGIVYRAFDKVLGRNVAVKTFMPGQSEDSDAAKRFRDEVARLIYVRHPGVVKVLDFGEHHSRDFLVMELVEGGNLEGRMFAPRSAIEIVIAVAEAIGAVHEQGIVHRDIKPSNVMMRADGSLVVTDFGLAKDATRAGHLRSLPGRLPPPGATELEASLTASGVWLGTPAYSAPEQVKGTKAAISPRTDVWALGVMLYELLARRRPFNGETEDTLAYQIVGEPPQEFRVASCGLPAEVDQVIQRCLRKAPKDRFANGAEVAAALRRAMEPHEEAAAETELADGPPAQATSLVLGEAGAPADTTSGDRRAGAPNADGPSPPKPTVYARTPAQEWAITGVGVYVLVLGVGAVVSLMVVLVGLIRMAWGALR